jgi:hypothetical protein
MKTVVLAGVFVFSFNVFAKDSNPEVCRDIRVEVAKVCGTAPADERGECIREITAQAIKMYNDDSAARDAEKQVQIQLTCDKAE